MRSQNLLADHDKQAVRCAAAPRHVPFVLEQRHRRFQATSSIRFFALEFEQVEPLEPGRRDAMPARKLLHVVVEGDQERVVCFSGNTDQFISRAAGNDILKRDEGVAVPDEDGSDGCRNALVQKDTEPRPRDGRRRARRGCPPP